MIIRKVMMSGDGGIIELEFNEDRAKAINIFRSKKNLTRVFCDNSGNIWATGLNGIVAHYNQQQWTYHELGSNKLFTKIIVDKGNVWLVGVSIPSEDSQKTNSNGLLLRSQDNGLTWEDKTPHSADGLTDIYINGDIGWLIGLNGSIYSTSDGGNSWVKQESPTKNSLVSIFELDPNNIWISGYNATVLKYYN